MTFFKNLNGIKNCDKLTDFPGTSNPDLLNLDHKVQVKRVVVKSLNPFAHEGPGYGYALLRHPRCFESQPMHWDEILQIMSK